MQKHISRIFLNPVWLLFVPPLVGRAFLLTHTIAPGYLLMSWTTYTLHLLFLLVLVVLTGHVAATLATTADLSERAHERFMVMSALGMLAPPLAIAVAESSLRLDFIASLILILWLISSSLRLIQGLETRAPIRQVAYHWACRGLACGLLLWLRPLLLLGLLAVVSYLTALLFVRKKPGSGYILAHLAFLPAGIIGSLPAIAWPIGKSYFIDLTLSIPGHQSASDPILLIALLSVLSTSTAGLLLALGSTVLANWWRHPICLRLYRLIGPLILFCGGALIASIISFLAPNTTTFPEDSMLILIIALPFFNAAIFILPYMVTQHRNEGEQKHTNDEGSYRKQKNSISLLHVLMLTLIALYFLSQLYTYIVLSQPPINP